MMKRIVLTVILFGCVAVHAQTNADWKLSVQTWTFHLNSFLESVDKADSLGLRYIEVYPGQKVGGSIPGVFSYTLDKDARDKIKDYLKYKKVSVIAIGVVDKYYYNNENLEQFFAFAQYMNIPFITAEPEWKDLDRFEQLAVKYHVKVALHSHPKPDSHYWHPDSTAAAMKGHPHIGAWPDIGHWARNGVDVKAALKQMGGKLWGMHFKDVRTFNDLQAEDTILGKGVLDIAGVMQQLKNRHFKGVFSIEYEMYPENNMAQMRENIAYYYAILKKLRP